MEIKIDAFNPTVNPVFPAQGPGLHPVELRILDLKKNGMTEREIAHELELTLNEVARRLEAIERKMGLQKIDAQSGEKGRGPA